MECPKCGSRNILKLKVIRNYQRKKRIGVRVIVNPKRYYCIECQHNYDYI